MCGRFQFSWDADDDAVRRLKELMALKFSHAATQPGDVCPGQTAPVLVPGRERANLTIMTWGIPLKQPGNRLVINVRGETAGEKAMFRQSLESRRCVIPTTGFYEWSADKNKFLFRQPDRLCLYLAGLYLGNPGEERFVIVTTAANSSVSPIHNRMPLVLGQAELLDWLKDRSQAERYICRSGPALRCQPV